ncbi:MAG: CsbD family protein [Phycisphaerae bacterium]
MSNDVIKGKWKQLRGEMKKRWGKLDGKLTEAEGDKDILVGKIQQEYGLKKDEARTQVDQWLAERGEDDDKKS